MAGWCLNLNDENRVGIGLSISNRYVSESQSSEQEMLAHLKRDTLNIPFNEEGTVNEVELKCEFWKCQLNANNTKELDNHIEIKHPSSS